ncbi:hypothetical protein QT327_01010 [Olivibacter sp. 47]|uniref:hypothetical protein n=1 Tax=Olivibacter sp. 47 TaxID=3056486 RepID=UPI0025A3ADDB|nr:hypothetical protein [Olivibacter sp. 47]MDM8172936.1 hypothetical protein [Olivibacter sp. 47]
MKKILILPLLAVSLVGYSQTNINMKMEDDNVKVTNEVNSIKREVSCKLTTPEMQRRKASIIASLKKQVIEKKELKDGFSYKFNGSDKIIDELSDFVKTERLCCDFFDFGLSVKGDGSNTWLTITGPKGTKNFITSELEL